MCSVGHPMARVVRKLASRNVLAPEDEAAILALPHVVRAYEPHSYLVRQGAPAKRISGLVLAGFACRQRITAQGARQIVSLHLPGDFLDLQGLFLARTHHNVQALTRLETVEIESSSLRAIAAERPAVARAMWVDTLVDASVTQEWAVAPPFANPSC
jgi:CRP-like cAMP-binding protein